MLAEFEEGLQVTQSFLGMCELDGMNGQPIFMGDCQNSGPFLRPSYSTGPNTGPNLGDPKRDHNFDNPPYIHI